MSSKKEKKSFSGIVAPIVSASILVLGMGLYIVLTSVQMESLNEPDWAIGLMSGIYYLGFLLGSYLCQYLILRVGHIRTYSVLNSILIISALLQGIAVNVWLWGPLRFLGGFAIAGNFLTLESWLLGASTRKNRGMILAVYSISYYLNQGFSNVLLRFHSTANNSQDLILYIVIAIFVTLSILPVTLTKFSAPYPESPEILSIKKLIKITPVGVFSTLVAGVVLSITYSLLAIYFKVGYSIDQVSTLMLVLFIGGTAGQLPFGKLSDLIDRRKVLCLMFLLIIITAGAFPFIYNNWSLLLVCVFLFGFIAFCLYPVAVSHTIDQLKPKELISGTAALCLIYGIGSCFGPPLVSWFTHIFGTQNAMIYFIMITSAVVLVFIIFDLFFGKAVDVDKQKESSIVPRTTPEIMQLNPKFTDAQIDEHHTTTLNKDKIK
mgnify:CR=1 FL=1|tara:strand:+ start:4408 stop:5709 length:1302 start_codon:yes stop_codon:yes gene_type:complete